MVQPATELAVAGSVLQRLTCVGRADRRSLLTHRPPPVLSVAHLDSDRAWIRI
jgi:hypothetical protein